MNDPIRKVFDSAQNAIEFVADKANDIERALTPKFSIPAPGQVLKSFGQGIARWAKVSTNDLQVITTSSGSTCFWSKDVIDAAIFSKATSGNGVQTFTAGGLQMSNTAGADGSGYAVIEVPQRIFADNPRVFIRCRPPETTAGTAGVPALLFFFGDVTVTDTGVTYGAEGFGIEFHPDTPSVRSVNLITVSGSTVTRTALSGTQWASGDVYDFEITVASGTSITVNYRENGSALTVGATSTTNIPVASTNVSSCTIGFSTGGATTAKQYGDATNVSVMR